MKVEAHSTTQISALNKGLGPMDRDATVAELVAHGWNLLREDLCLPTAVLSAERLQHNLDWMRRFIDAYGLKLAPHGKTTMAPRLFRMQLESGSWGITLATAQQVRVAYTHGVRRVLMANQLVGRANMESVAELLRNRDFDFFCLLDSSALAEQLGPFFAERGIHLQVLLELGVPGGRTGVRDEAQLRDILQSLEKHRHSLKLCGVELYEGVLNDEAQIRTFLRRAVDVTRRLAKESHFHRAPFVLSGAGSAWYDVVAEEFAAANFGDAAELVLRPGCYLTHDVGAYQAAQERILAANPIARAMREGLRPALQVWACVQSRPEPERAIVAMGKRDAAFDSGLPVPALHFRPGDAAPHSAPAHWKTTRMMDQHAYLEIAATDNLYVGDMISFDIAHPCLTFDKWRTLPVVNAQYDVVDVVQTYF
ncbi:MAG TPA: amino acid deaminase [Terracidiphilus sp.]|nr:amino acid deaminase [Terracidiphilus sp.]